MRADVAQHLLYENALPGPPILALVVSQHGSETGWVNPRFAPALAQGALIRRPPPSVVSPRPELRRAPRPRPLPPGGVSRVGDSPARSPDILPLTPPAVPVLA